jgi:predicted nucleic acid-binding protein
VIAYVDASVLLRVLLGEPGRWRDWGTVEIAVSSALAEVEILRTLDRLRLRGDLSVEETAERRGAAIRVMQAVSIVEVSAAVLRRAADPFPTPLGTLDAIHLATALAWREHRGSLTMATHDVQLALAARACGFAVVGTERQTPIRNTANR